MKAKTLIRVETCKRCEQSLTVDVLKAIYQYLNSQISQSNITSKQYLITSDSPRGFPFNPFMRSSLKGGLRQNYIPPHSHLVPGIDRHRHGEEVEEGHKHSLEENSLQRKNENFELE